MLTSSSQDSTNRVSSSVGTNADDDSPSTTGEHVPFRTELLEELELFLETANHTENLDSAFVTVYVNEPGDTAAAFGSEDVKDGLKRLDEFIYEVSF